MLAQVNSFSWVLGAANIQNGSRFFVENAGRAELDARGEFVHDVDEHALYMILPARSSTSSTPAGLEVVAAISQRLLEVRSSAVRRSDGVRKSRRERWVEHLHFGPGLDFGMTAPTFLELYESTGRGNNDWSIHRGGSIFIEGVRDVSVRGCTVAQTGGNAIFISHANEDIVVEGNTIGPGIGDSVSK